MRCDFNHQHGWPVLAMAGLFFATVSGLTAQSGQPLVIVNDSLPPGSVGVAYNQQLTVTGGLCQGAGVATSTIDAGALPAGLVIASPPAQKQWLIVGTPASSGSFQFTVHLRWTHTRISPFDLPCVDEAVKALTITVQGPGGGPPAQTLLTVDRTQISVTYRTAHFPPAAETVQVGSSGSAASGTAALTFTAQAVTSSGGSWLSVTPPTGVTPAALSIAFDITGLRPGVYTGAVTVASAPLNPVVIAVTLTVITDANLVLQVAPASLAFSYVINGQIPASQSLTVTVSGDSVIFQADVTAPPNGKWLSVTPAGAATPAKLTVSVDPTGLTPGQYSGIIALHPAGVLNNSQMVPVTFSVQTSPVLPAISPNGVVNAANLGAAISPGTWVSIFGANLSSTTRPWRDADFVSGRLPTSLDGVSVTINGKPAAVAYVSPSQINVLTPDETATGLVPVQVKNPSGTSDNALVLEQTIAPAFFQFRAGAITYVAGTHADGTYLAGASLVQQGIPGTPAKPGETIVLFGTGFGATLPPISATALVPAPLTLANPQDLRVRIGGIDAAIAFAGLISPGVYQFNVVAPQVDDGDRTVVAELRGLLTRSDLMLSVQH